VKISIIINVTAQKFKFKRPSGSKNQGLPTNSCLLTTPLRFHLHKVAGIAPDNFEGNLNGVNAVGNGPAFEEFMCPVSNPALNWECSASQPFGIS
jgi:hypothetical protein